MSRNGLTLKQQRFVAFLPECEWNATEAARRAGYEHKNASRQAVRLKQDPAVQQAIADLIEREKRGEDKPQERGLPKVIDELWDVAINGSSRERLGALRELRQHYEPDRPQEPQKHLHVHASASEVQQLASLIAQSIGATGHEPTPRRDPPRLDPPRLDASTDAEQQEPNL